MICPTCKKELSNQAHTCPNCGHPFRNMQTPRPIIQPTTQPVTNITVEQKEGCISEGLGCVVFWIGVIVFLMLIAAFCR